MKSYLATAAYALATTFTNFFRKAVTVEFPDVIRPRAERYRASFALLHEEDGDEACIGCLQCERICPSEVISIKAGGKRESPITGKKRGYADDFVLDLNACIYCELCVQVCPTDAIVMTREPELPAYGREDLVLTMAKLYANEKSKLRAWGDATRLNAMQTPPKPPKAEPAAAASKRSGATLCSGAAPADRASAPAGCRRRALRPPRRQRTHLPAPAPATGRALRSRLVGASGGAGGSGTGYRGAPSARPAPRRRHRRCERSGRTRRRRRARPSAPRRPAVRARQLPRHAAQTASAPARRPPPAARSPSAELDGGGHAVSGSELGFGLLAFLLVGFPAIRVVTSGDLVRAVLWLAATLLGTAVVYALLHAPFLAGVQVLTYVGGVVTLMIFGVMVTRKHDGTTVGHRRHQPRPRARWRPWPSSASSRCAILRTDLSELTARRAAVDPGSRARRCSTATSSPSRSPRCCCSRPSSARWCSPGGGTRRPRRPRPRSRRRSREGSVP